MHDQLENIGAVICAAGSGLAPADQKMSALRDVTGTVESIPLISASIMSKKIAESTGALVSDMKVGSGAFMANLEQARELATTMVALGHNQGLAVSDLLTGMDVPLGLAVGNAVETVEAQGGDPDAPLPQASVVETSVAEQAETVVTVDVRSVGVAAWRLGAGRAGKWDPVDPATGVICRVTPGDDVAGSGPLSTCTPAIPSAVERARGVLGKAVRFDGPAPAPLIIERIG